MGVYKMGDLIVSQEFQKVSIKGGKFVTEKKNYQWQENPCRREKAQAPS